MVTKTEHPDGGPETITIAAFQGRVAFGDADANLDTIEENVRRAQDAGCAIVCFPETFLHGYFPDEALARRNALSLDGPEFAGILARLSSYSPTILFGLNELRGDDIYNTEVVIERGVLVGRYSKNYLVYDYFKRGHEFPVFERDGVTFGVIICADSSFSEPARIEAMRGAQIIFSPHFNYIGYEGLDDHTYRVRNHHIALAVKNDVYVVKSNVVVPEGVGAPIFGRAGVGVGESFILNRRGRPMAEAGLCTETLLVHTIEKRDLAGDRRPFQRTDKVIADTLAAEYAKFAG